MTYLETLARLEAIAGTSTEGTDETVKSPETCTETPGHPTDKTDTRGSVSSVSPFPGDSENLSRVDRATAIARHVASRVAAVAPDGLGRWARAWEIVEGPSTVFLDALHRWETAEDPSPTAEAALRDDLRTAADDVVTAWSDAAVEWRAAR